MERKHPEGIIMSNFGDVDSVKGYYDYQFCRRIENSVPGIKSMKLILKQLDKNSPEDIIENIVSTTDVIDRRDEYVFSIDQKVVKISMMRLV